MIEKKPNIVFIVFDTCRFDVFNEVLNEGKLPNLNELINKSIYYENAISPSSWTTPSHVSYFTGLYPSEHRVHETQTLKQSSVIMNQIYNFPGKFLTEVLKENGYNTYGFVANPNLSPGTGFERGFDYLGFIDMFEDLYDLWEVTRLKLRNEFPKSEDEIIRLANNFDLKEMIRFSCKNWNFLKLPGMISIYRKFLKIARSLGYPEQKGGKKIVNVIKNSAFENPFFLFINFMEMHDPYSVGKGEFFSGEGKKMLSFLSGENNIRPEVLNTYKKLYKRELTLLDQHMGDLIGKLKKSEVYDDTVIIITADHGQNFGEEHFYGHGVLLSDSLIRVPLIIKPISKVELPVNNRYQPLTNLFKFLVRCSEGIVDLDLLSEDIAYSESFGIQEDYNEMLKFEPAIISKLQKYDHRSLAVYFEDIKAIASVEMNKYKIELISSSNSHVPVDEYKIKKINDHFKKFLGFRYENISQDREVEK